VNLAPRERLAAEPTAGQDFTSGVPMSRCFWGYCCCSRLFMVKRLFPGATALLGKGARAC